MSYGSFDYSIGKLEIDILGEGLLYTIPGLGHTVPSVEFIAAACLQTEEIGIR